ncbi:VanZ family protein [Caldithrix abyssi]
MEENRTLRNLKILSIVTILFIVYNTLIPFKPYLEPWKIIRNLHRVELIPFIARGKLNPLTDLVGNVILFMPFGFFIALYFIHLNRKVRLGRVVLLGFLLSLCIEVLQIGFRYRTPSVTDLITNTLGTFIGVVLARIYFKELEERLKKILHHILENEPITLILILIILIQFFASMLPFNVTITVSDLKKAIAYTNIEPFGFKPLGLMLGAHVKHLERFSFSVIDFVGNMLFYAVFGYLVLYSYYQYWRGTRYGRLLILGLLIVYFPVLEVTQFFIKSRFSDVNDIISGYLGAWSGALLFLLLKKEHWFANDKTLRFHHFVAPFLIYLIYVFYKGFSPFNFSLQPDVLALNLKVRYLAPFYAYYKVTSLWNIYDLLESFFWLMPLGFAIAYHARSRGAERQMFLRAIFAGLAISAIIEISQLFLPTRTGDITDVIFMTIGSYMGAYLFRYYWETYVARTQPSDFVKSLKT